MDDEPEECVGVNKPFVYTFFDFLESGWHVINEGGEDEKKVKCEFYVCKHKVCRIQHDRRAFCILLHLALGLTESAACP